MTEVTADQVEALRAYLKGDADSHNRIFGRLDPAARSGYATLIPAAFFVASEKKFKNATKSDVIEFVSKLRSQYDLAEDLDPRTAERLILATFTDEDIDDIPDETKGSHFILLLGALVNEANLSDAELDEFLAAARKLTDEWLG